MDKSILNLVSKGGVILLFFIFLIGGLAGAIEKNYVVPAVLWVLIMILLRFGWRITR